jgi:hypothetical protein
LNSKPLALQKVFGLTVFILLIEIFWNISIIFCSFRFISIASGTFIA